MGLKTNDLPFNQRIEDQLNNNFMRGALAKAQDLINAKRDKAFDELGNYQEWRDCAAAIREHVLEHLDYYLDQFVTNAEQAGSRLYFAENGEQATRHALDICSRIEARKVVKSKSMVTEEIDLNHALEDAGMEVIETDLGEYLLQIDNHDKPSHIVIPALHNDRERFRAILAERKGYRGTAEPEDMTRFVRQVIRRDFMEADVSITGCNFGVASTGTCTLVTNEGNGRFVTTVPRVQIVLMGMERLVPTFTDLDTMLTMLVRSAVGGKLTSYVSLLTGPRQEDDADGPDELHIIIVDNNRSKVMEGQSRDVLRCIRCGTCMFICPCYRHISGHGYGALYPGPLGVALMPALGGYESFGEITKICSLCGACNEVCPVKIPLYEIIYEHRRMMAEELRQTTSGENMAMQAYGSVLGSPSLYGAATRLSALAAILPKAGPLGAWCSRRDLPPMGGKRFRDWYRQNREDKS